jgi:hypothetical protein
MGGRQRENAPKVGFSHGLGGHTLVAWNILVPSESRTSFYEATLHIMRLAEVLLEGYESNAQHTEYGNGM